MPVRMTGGVFDEQILTGSLAHYVICGADFSGAIGTYGQAVANSAAEIIFTRISEGAYINIMNPNECNLSFALEAGRSVWDEISLTAMVQSLGTNVGIDNVDCSVCTVRRVPYKWGCDTSFLQLTDTPSTYTGAANYVVTVNSTADGLVFTPVGITSNAFSFVSSPNQPTLTATGSDTLGLVAGSNITITLDALTNQATINSTASGSGSVSSVSVVPANGLSGTVSNATTTPAITLSTSVTGIIRGNGTSLSAATPGDFPTLNQNTTGSSATLTTPRSISITGDASWSVSFDGSADVTGTITLATVPVSRGGTGLTTYAAGSILYASATDLLSALPVGTNGQVLTVVSGAPAWQPAGAGGGSNNYIPVPPGSALTLSEKYFVTASGRVTLPDISISAVAGTSVEVTKGVGYAIFIDIGNVLDLINTDLGVTDAIEVDTTESCIFIVSSVGNWQLQIGSIV